MHKHLLQILLPCAIISSAFTVQAATITTDSEYSTVPTENLHAANGAKLTFGFDSDAIFAFQITGESGTTIQFRNNSTSAAISHKFSKTVANDSIEQIWGSLIIGGAEDTHATILNFKEADRSFTLEEDLTIYGNSELYTNAGRTTYSYINGHLSCLRTAATLTPQEAASTPILSVSISLRDLSNLTLEQSINLNAHNLQLVKDNFPRTRTLTPDLVTTTNDNKSCTLFTNVYQVDGLKQGIEYNAADYFSSSYIDENTKLVWNKEGSLVLTGLVTDVIPEPSTASLSLLALFALAMRRRRA